MTTDDTAMTAVVLLYSRCIVSEVTEVASRLAMAGVRVVWASPDGERLTDLSGLMVTPNKSMASIKLALLCRYFIGFSVCQRNSVIKSQNLVLNKL